MNKSLLLLQTIAGLMEDSGISYNTEQGLKLIRYGGKDRFSPSVNTHYNTAPVPRGTWASVYPFGQLAPFPEPHNNLYKNLTDQSIAQKHLYASNTGTGLLKPVHFYWNHAIYSHIDKNGSYQNRGWVFYPNVKDLVAVIERSLPQLKQSVNTVKMNSTNVNQPGSVQTYFKNHEWEVFVPSENVRTSA